MSSTVLSSKGQLVVPREIRQRLGLSPGDKLECEVQGEALVITPSKKERATSRVASDGFPVLSAPASSPEMTPELVKSLLHD